MQPDPLSDGGSSTLNLFCVRGGRDPKDLHFVPLLYRQYMSQRVTFLKVSCGNFLIRLPEYKRMTIRPQVLRRRKLPYPSLSPVARLVPGYICKQRVILPS